jgi:hypothetical protein
MDSVQLFCQKVPLGPLELPKTVKNLRKTRRKKKGLIQLVTWTSFSYDSVIFRVRPSRAPPASLLVSRTSAAMRGGVLGPQEGGGIALICVYDGAQCYMYIYIYMMGRNVICI